MEHTHTLIVGASASGLAAAACLGRKNIPYIIIEARAHVANSWRNHYDRLHLHTSKPLSHLPFKKFDDALPKYPSRVNVVEYLESYQKEMNINPVFNTEVKSIKREDELWITETNKDTYTSNNIIIATGLNHKPKMASFKAMETFTGKVLHSSQYKNGKEFEGKNVLVVGFGNSGCEIAIDLFEHGAYPALAVRSPVNVLPHDIFGIPILQLGLLSSHLPPRLADKINAPLIRFIIGDITKLGLKKSTLGPLEQIHKEKRIPLLDIGTIKLIREGHIKVYGDVDYIDHSSVHFKDQKQQSFDAIILATGYTNDLNSFVKVDPIRFDDLDTSADKQKYFGKDGLYFCGFFISPTGMLREIAMDAQKIADAIVRKINQ